MKASFLISVIIFISIHVGHSQDWEKQYDQAIKKVIIKERDEFTGDRLIEIKDPRFVRESGIRIKPYLVITKEGITFYRMKVRVAAFNWMYAEDLYIKINNNDHIIHYPLGNEEHVASDENLNYEFYDILINETLLRKLAYSKTIKMRVQGAYKKDGELSPKRQESIRDLHTFIMLSRRIKPDYLPVAL